MSKKYGILAYPAKHSLSPVMHNAAFKACNIDADYSLFEIPENGLADFIEMVKYKRISGFSVSLPYKEKIISYLDEIDHDARQIGAVNTVINREGFLHGENTDYLASNKSLTEVAGNLEGKKVVVLGAGGGARAIIYGLLKEGAKIAIYNRDREKAKTMANQFSKLFGSDVLAAGLEDRWKVDKADILIQSTSIWLLDAEGKADFVSEDFVERFDVVMDIVYKPLETPLIKMARGLGKKVITGDRMLLYQAVEQFKLWTGIEAPVDLMKQALQTELHATITQTLKF